MTGFQAVRPRPAVATAPAVRPEFVQPVAGKHGSVVRARFTLRRLFYVARHAAG